MLLSGESHSLQISLGDLLGNHVCQFFPSTHWRGKPLSPGKGLTPVVPHLLDRGPGRSAVGRHSILLRLWHLRD